MERTSLITAMYIADSSAYPFITFVNGLPNAGSLETYFEKVPLVLEKADLRESTEDSDQGLLTDISIRANIYRDSDYYRQFKNSFVLAYLETANEEKYFYGSLKNPLSYQYTRDSGTANADQRETSLLMGQKTAV
jgi:hypothetical protein